MASLQSSAESAALSIGRLDAMLDGHPLRLAWEHRQRLDAAVEATGWDGVGIDRARLAARLIGAPMKRIYGHASHGNNEHRALAFLEALSRLCAVSRLARAGDALPEDDAETIVGSSLGLGAFLRAVEHSRAGSSLMAVADAAWSVRRERDAMPGSLHAAIPHALERLGIIRSGFLPGIAAFPPKRSDRVEWMGLFLDGLARKADDGLSLLHGLSLTCADWQRRVGPRQKNSRLPQVVVAALCRPFLSPASTQALFDCTGSGKNKKWNLSLPGASKLLGELEAIGVLAEESGRTGSHRLFVALEFGIGSAVERRDGRRAPPPRIPHPRAMVGSIGSRLLDDAMAEAAGAISKTDGALVRLGFAKPERATPDEGTDWLRPLPDDEDAVEPLDVIDGDAVALF